MFIFDTIKYAWRLHKYNKILNKVYKDENVIENIKETFGLDIQRAWWGRLYAIVNPLVKNDKMKYGDIIYDLENGKVSADLYMNKVIIETLSQMKEFVIEKSLFDLLVYNVTRLDEYGNYLFIMEPQPREEFVTNFIKTIKLLGVTSVLSIVGLLSYIFLF